MSQMPANWAEFEGNYRYFESLRFYTMPGKMRGHNELARKVTLNLLAQYFPWLIGHYEAFRIKDLAGMQKTNLEDRVYERNAERWREDKLSAEARKTSE